MAPVYADHPFPLIATPISLAKTEEEKDIFTECASEMAIVHNMVVRGLNAIYLQAPHISPADEVPFARFAEHWCMLLSAHHGGEEAEFFPGLEAMTGEAGLMDGNVEQHHAFHDGLHGFERYVKGVAEGTEKYDGHRVVALVDSFGHVLVEHLIDEIPTLLGLRRFGKEKMAAYPKMFEEEGQRIMSQIGLFTGMSFCTTQHDIDYEGGRWANWPPAPWIILWFCRNIAFWVHKDWWRFGACDRKGHMQPLYAIPENKESKA